MGVDQYVALYHHVILSEARKKSVFSRGIKRSERVEMT
jgi:hypothetical protein